MSRKTRPVNGTFIWVYPTVAAINIPDSVVTQIMFDGIHYDRLNEYNAITGRFTPRHSGIYIMKAQIRWVATPIGGYRQTVIDGNGAFVDGAFAENEHALAMESSQQAVTIAQVLPTQQIRVYVYQDCGFAAQVMGGTVQDTYFSIRRIS